MSTDRSFNPFPTVLSSVSEDLPQKKKLPHRNGAVSYNILSYARMADYVWVAVGNKICGKCDSTMHSSSCKKGLSDNSESPLNSSNIQITR